jgi:hypothetical protein
MADRVGRTRPFFPVPRFTAFSLSSRTPLCLVAVTLLGGPGAAQLSVPTAEVRAARCTSATLSDHRAKRIEEHGTCDHRRASPFEGPQTTQAGTPRPYAGGGHHSRAFDARQGEHQSESFNVRWPGRCSNEVRHVRMNQPHPARLTPSWCGDSVGGPLKQVSASY